MNHFISLGSHIAKLVIIVKGSRFWIMSNYCKVISSLVTTQIPWQGSQRAWCKALWQARRGCRWLVPVSESHLWSPLHCPTCCQTSDCVALRSTDSSPLAAGGRWTLDLENNHYMSDNKSLHLYIFLKMSMVNNIRFTGFQKRLHNKYSLF